MKAETDPIRRISICSSSAGENLTMVFTLKDWGTTSRAFSIKNTPTTQIPTTSSHITEPTPTTTTGQVTDDSIFGSGTTASAGALCLASVIYTVACCSDAVPIG